MKSLIRITALTTLMVGAALFAQTAPKPAPKLPTISPDLKAQFFKAQAQLLQAQAESERAAKAVKDKTDAFQATIAELAKTCGDSFQPNLDPQGDPVCALKPVMPKSAAK